MDDNVTAIVPAFNEEENIEETVSALKQIKGIKEIIVVDDGSKDNTYSIIKKIHGIKVIQNEKNRGKGFAIKAALPHVSNGFVLLIDGDLKGTASEMKKLVESTEKSNSTMLVGKYPKPLKKGGFGLVKALSKKSLYMLTAKNSDTVLSGQRLLSTDFLKSIDIPDNFGLEFKITLEALRKNIRIVDIPLSIRHRETGRDIKGIIHRGKQFINILTVVIRELI